MPRACACRRHRATVMADRLCRAPPSSIRYPPGSAHEHQMRFDQLKRRDFIALIGGAATGWPLVTRAQQPAKLPVLGVLVIGNIDPQQFWRESRQGLRDLGYVEG